MKASTRQLTEQLDSFDPAERRAALERLAEMARDREVPLAPPSRWINLHCHTFFSYNAYGYSPSRFAWEAYRQGLEVGGIVDFDCLDGTREFLKAGRLLGLKTVAGLETRVFIAEWRDRVTNSPKEPGVAYLMTTGFTEPPAPGTPAARTLSGMAERARRRNLAVMEKVNDHLDPVRIDYARHAVPLTVAGNVTERHMLDAYDRLARERFPGASDLAAFWSAKLNKGLDEVAALLGNAPALKELVRARLMKHGGVGYAQPDETSFPPLNDVVEMTLACGALPSAGWLDGTNEGEKDPVAQFGFLRDKGCVTATIIPDRNWNVKAGERELKIANLHRAVAAAQQLELPILVGTEMNKHGNKFVDAFDNEALAPHLEEFRSGAHVAWGHTLLKMTAGVGYVGPWADAYFGERVGEKNEFFRRIGATDYPGEGVLKRLTQLGPDSAPDDLRDSVAP